MPDPLSISCKCGAQPGQPCVRKAKDGAVLGARVQPHPYRKAAGASRFAGIVTPATSWRVSAATAAAAKARFLSKGSARSTHST